jgi:hypothetical protein
MGFALLVPLIIQSAFVAATAARGTSFIWVAFVFSLFSGYLLVLRETDHKHALPIAVAYFPLMSLALLYVSLALAGKVTGNWL